MDDLGHLEALQRALLTALHDEVDPAATVRPHAAAWVETWEPEAVRVAQALVRRWTRRRSPPGPVRD